MSPSESAALTSILSSNLGVSASRFEVNQSLFPNFTVELSVMTRYSSSRLLLDALNSSNNSNSSNETGFSIPTVQKNSLLLSIMLLPELMDPASINMFKVLEKLKNSLAIIPTACIILILFIFIIFYLNYLIISEKIANKVKTNANLNSSFGTNGMFWYFAHIDSNKWSHRPSISKIWTNSVDVENIGLSFPGLVLSKISLY